MKPPRSSTSEPYFTATPQTLASGSLKLKPYPQPDRVGSESNAATRRARAAVVDANDFLLVLTVDRERDAAKPFGDTAELPLEPRLGEEPETTPFVH